MFYGHLVFLVTHSQTPKNYLKHQMTNIFSLFDGEKIFKFLNGLKWPWWSLSVFGHSGKFECKVVCHLVFEAILLIDNFCYCNLFLFFEYFNKSIQLSGNFVIFLIWPNLIKRFEVTRCFG